MSEYKYYEQLNDRKINILEDLYNYRAMTTDQIKRIYFPNSKFYVNKVLYQLRKSKYIASNTLKGSRKNKKGITYHRLTETGVKCLLRHGVNVEGQVQNMYVKPSQLHYLLLANDVMIELRKEGWEMWDSRRVKKKYNLDDRMNILGVLISPKGEQYGFYVVEDGIYSNTLGKIQSEIKVNHSIINNYIVFARGQNAYNEFVKRAMDEEKPLNTGHKLKILPFTTGLKFLGKYPDKTEWIKQMADHFGFEIASMEKTEKRQTFDTIIKYKGKEMYLVDLTDTNITTIHAINSYNERAYDWENRRRLLISSPAPQLTILEDYIKSMYVEYLPISSQDFSQLL